MTSTAPSIRGRSTGPVTELPPAVGRARVIGDVESAVRRDLRKIKKRDPELVKGGLAASAVALARELDNDKNSATSKSMCQRALRETLDRLHELAPPLETNDRIEDLHERAALKLAGKPAT